MLFKDKFKKSRRSSIILCVSILLLLPLGAGQQVSGQTDYSKVQFVSGGFGIGLGVFYPSDINDFIADEMDRFLIVSGISDMIINYFFKASLSLRPHKIFEFTFFAEYGWAPKLIYATDDIEYYYFSFTRIAPGFSPRVHIPLGSGRHSMYFAPGLTYNMMKFHYSEMSEDLKANALGWRMHMGFELNFGKVSIEPFFGWDSALGKHDDFFELDYTGGQLGVDIIF